MKNFYKNNKYFLLFFIIVIVGITPIFFIYDKITIHSSLNSYNSPFLDIFFKYITYLGDGFTVAVIAFFLLFVSLRYAFFIGFSNIAVSAVVQFMKHVIFEEIDRPAPVFERLKIDLHLADGVKNHCCHSFPSGHTAAAFCLFFGLAVLVKSDILKAIFFILALLTAYSRIYLSQHFVIDTYFGSLIGVLIAIAFYFLIIKSKLTWLDKSIISLFKKNEK